MLWLSPIDVRFFVSIRGVDATRSCGGAMASMECRGWFERGFLEDKAAGGIDPEAL